MNHNFSGILFSEQEIADRVSQLAEEITDHYKKIPADELVVIGILRGAVMFMSDLIRRMDLPIIVDFMVVSSYGDATVSSGSVNILKDTAEEIKGRHVLLVEDIIDTGNTLNCLKKLLYEREPQSLAICTLLDKPARRVCDIKVDFCGFQIPDEFIVGYGLDYASRFRELPYIAILDPAVYSK
ncbi:MAG: hypoxanthine phosphoribosyltransferase [Bacillota bacterium]|jgi:hypoxanthine phosphoribosyltransferase